MLLIESDVIKFVPKVDNLGFILNVCQKVYLSLRSLRSRALHTPLEVGCVTFYASHWVGGIGAGADAKTIHLQPFI
jgi:hypothetical protein